MEISLVFIVPNTLGTKNLFLLHSFFTEVGLIDFNWLYEACLGFKGVEQDHKILGGDVHPVVIAKCEPFGGLDVFMLDKVLFIIGPNLGHVFFLILNELLNGHVSQWRRLFIILLHPFPKVPNFRLLFFLVLFVLLLLLHSIIVLFWVIVFMFFWYILVLVDLLLVLVHVKLFQLLVLSLFGLLFSVDLTSVFVYFTEVLEFSVCQHLAKTLVDLYLCDLFLWTQKLRIIWCLRESLIHFNILRWFYFVLFVFGLSIIVIRGQIFLIWMIRIFLVIKFGNVFTFIFRIGR